MTEEQYEKARFIKSEIDKCEQILRHDMKGVFYKHDHPFVSLGNEVNEKIKEIVKERLEELKKEFEEL